MKNFCKINFLRLNLDKDTTKMSDDLFDVFVEETEPEKVTAYTLPTGKEKLTKNVSNLKIDDKEDSEIVQAKSKKRDLDEIDAEEPSDNKRFEQEDFDDWR